MNAVTKVEPHGLDLLRAPFPPHQISKLPKETRAQIDARKNRESGCMVFNCKVCGGHHHKDAVHLDYVGHAALTDRLLDTDIQWSWEPVAFGPDGLPAFDRNGGLWIRLTVGGVTRLGYGSADGKSGGDAVKEIIGDALRNAAMRFGAALDLWHKGDLHAEDESDTNGATGDTTGDRQISSGGPDTARNNPPQGMPDAAFAKLVQLVQATSSDTIRLCKHYEVQNLNQLSPQQYDEAIDVLNAKLAKMAKADTNKAAVDFGKELDDAINF